MAEDTQEPNSKERRSLIQTVVDRKTLPTLIPVLLAVGSAFITLDRTIQRIVIEQREIVEDVDHNHEHLIKAEQALTQLLPLKEEFDEHVEKQTQVTANITAVQLAADIIKQTTVNNQSNINELTGRVRSVERQVDRLEAQKNLPYSEDVSP